MNTQASNFRKKTYKIFLIAAGSCAALAFIAIATAYFLLRGSLPQMSGEALVPGLSAPAIVKRDNAGIPTIQAASRLDVAHALGFVHAQERFFQMDLMRRAAAGELSELFGAAAIRFDKQRRLHQFRNHVKQIYNGLSPDEVALLNAYAEGVNSGLDALSVRPFEYLILQSDPDYWKPEDALLVSFGLFFELQDSTGNADLTRGYMKELLPNAVYDFFVNNGSYWEAALDGSRLPIRDIPGPEEFSYLRSFDIERNQKISAIKDVGNLGGSNNWAITGSRTADGKAIVACDMHLRLAVPNIWYRAAFIYPDKHGEETSISGATLPGTPCMIIGSNGRIAWGWTNAFIDTTDIIIVKADDADPDRYLVPGGSLPFQRETEMIMVKGENPIPLQVTKTIWGPLAEEKFFDSPVAIQWVAHREDALNMRLAELETVKSSEEALQAIREIKIPVLNFVVADSQGHIAWSLIGAIPKRKGFDGTAPVSCADGEMKWEGLADAEKYPVVFDPSQEIVWTANNRVLGEDTLRFNQEGYINGIRAYQIRDKLQKASQAAPEDMLAIQMDTEGLFFERWQSLLLTLLQDKPQFAELKEAVQAWDKHSDPGSAGYYWIRRFREITLQHLLARVLHPCFEAWPDFAHTNRDFEEPVWMLVSQKPEYLINPAYGSWENELLAYIKEMLEKDIDDSDSVKDITWGRKTVLQMKHPLSSALPFLKPFLDMPSESVPGDLFMPKVAGPREGASQRMVVSPGNEKAGIFHAPGGQSGHPLSPHYRDGHEDWITGAPSRFLPGEAVHTLVLRP